MIDNLQTDNDVKIGGNITTTAQENKQLWKDITGSEIDIGGGTSVVRITSTNALVVPVGTQAERTNNCQVGGIRYNTTKSQYEGCVNVGDPANLIAPKFKKLGGLMDVDEDTFITTESADAADEDYLRFVTAGVEKMRINSAGKTGIGINYRSPIALYVGGNDSLHLPSGTTAQRPTTTSTTEQGYIRWNSEKQTFEGFGKISLGTIISWCG